MKTDRQTDPYTKPVSAVANTHTSCASSADNNNLSKSTKRRKVADSEASTSPRGAIAAAATSGQAAAGKKRSAIDEHRIEEDGVAIRGVSGSVRKKRVPTTVRTSHSRRNDRQQQEHLQSDAEPDEDVDVESMDIESSQQSSEVAATPVSAGDLVVKHGGPRRRGSAAVADPTAGSSNATTHSSPLKKKTQLKGAEAETVPMSDSNGLANGDAKADKSRRQTALRIDAESLNAPAIKEHITAVKPQKPSSRSKVPPAHFAVATTSPHSSVAASSPPIDHGLQKRVLPSRGGMLRDKTGGVSIEASILAPPIIPAGEYILYLTDSHVFQRADVDRNRIPPAAYNGVAEDPGMSTPQTATEYKIEDHTLTTVALSSCPPPSAITHIEVPIFRPCSINQFLQEEKKRKMQMLSKALAKAEAEAAAEALAIANATTTPTTTSYRTVSTRLKHKEVVQNQHVLVQTALPSWAQHSSAHGKKAVITNTTLGKIEGDAQEEVLTDEVYEKRHRKQEMAEKKVKNREKEKLRHTMYQQQLVVEKLRHIEINRLMPISAFRSLQKTVEQEQQQHQQELGSGSGSGSGTDETAPLHQAPISLAAARIMQDEYHRRLLREAEENLRRYEQLGLNETSNLSMAPIHSPFSRTKNRLLTMVPTSRTEARHLTAGGKAPDLKHDRRDRHVNQRSDSASSVLRSSGDTEEKRIRKRARANDSRGDDHEEGAGRTNTKTSSTSTSTKPASSSFITTVSTSKMLSSQKLASKKQEEQLQQPQRPPKPITTFIKPGSVLASGARKSSRVALAFGEKVPTLDRMDFVLPKDGFSELLMKRAENNPLLLMELKRMRLPAPAESETSSTTNSIAPSAAEQTTFSSSSSSSSASVSSSLTSLSSMSSIKAS